MTSKRKTKIIRVSIVLVIIISIIAVCAYFINTILKPTPDDNRFTMKDVHIRIYGLVENDSNCVTLTKFIGSKPSIEVSFDYDYFPDSTKWGNIGYRQEGVDGAMEKIKEINLYLNGTNKISDSLKPVNNFKFTLDEGLIVHSGTVIEDNCYLSLELENFEVFKEKYNKRESELTGKNEIERAMLFDLQNTNINVKDTLVLEVIIEPNKVIADTLIVN